MYISLDNWRYYNDDRALKISNFARKQCDAEYESRTISREREGERVPDPGHPLDIGGYDGSEDGWKGTRVIQVAGELQQIATSLDAYSTQTTG